MTSAATPSTALDGEPRKFFSLEDIFEPPLLIILQALLSETGYTCLPYPEYPAPPAIGIGWYTYPGRKIIYYNPHHVKDRGPVYAFPIFAHEIGHHDSDVVLFQDACSKVGDSYAHLFRGILPIHKILKLLNNCTADIFLEERNSRGVYKSMMTQLYRRALAQDCLPEASFHQYERDLTSENFPWDKAIDPQEKRYLYQDFCNGILLMAKFGIPPQGVFDERVYKVLTRAHPHILTIANINKTQVNLAQKVHAQIQLFGMVAQLVDEDYKEIENQARDPDTPTLAQLLADFEGMLDQETDGKVPIAIVAADNDTPTTPAIANTHDATAEAIKSALKNLLRGLTHLDAGQLGVPAEELRSYLTYVEKYGPYIEHLTDVLIEILLKDRELQQVSGRRDGFMVEPGMEALTYGAYLGGDLEPPTLLDYELEPNPLSLQAALAFDTSGSMSSYNEGMLGLLAILIESIRQIHERTLTQAARYHYRAGQRMPAALELSVFADAPELILKMTDTLTLSLAVSKFNEMQKKGGGTVTHKILEFEYDRLTALQDDRIVRVLTLVTDGQDEGPLLRRIVNKIVSDPRIYFLVVGVGPNEAVRDSIMSMYRRHLTPQSKFRVFAQGFPTVDMAIVSIINFFSMALETEKERRDAARHGGLVLSGY